MAKLRECYRWEDVPGNGDGFLRYGEDGRIVTAALQPKLNPDAPQVILVGRGRKRESSSQTLCEQFLPVSVYLKRATNRWEYAGEFVVERYSDAIPEIREHEQRSKRNDVVRVIYMKEHRS